MSKHIHFSALSNYDQIEEAHIKSPAVVAILNESYEGEGKIKLCIGN